MKDLSRQQNHYDYLIIGAGPAGLQMGYYLEKQGHQYLILEKGDEPGSFFKQFPRHGQLISINKVYTGYSNKEMNLRWDWNSLLSDNDELLFKNYSKLYFPKTNELNQYLQDFAQYFQLKIKYGVKVKQISKTNRFIVSDDLGNIYSCQHLIIATGVSQLYIPEILGIETAEKYTDVSVDPEDFKNQSVLIIGKGNSAFETADNLVSTAAKIHLASPHSVNMAWKTHYVGHLRAVNNNILDTYHLKSQNAIIDATISKIQRQDEKFLVTFNYSHAGNEVEDILYDRVILCTGFQFDNSLFEESCKPELVINNRFPAQTSEWESTNVKDLYFIGTLMQMRDFKKYMSGFIHGFRYNIQALSKILAHKYHQQELPYEKLENLPVTIANAIIARINITSALWQQPGFLGDLIIVPKNSDSAYYYQDLPLDYVQEKMMITDDYFLITLEYGKNKAPDPFNIERIERTNKEQAELSVFLHPVIKQYRNKQLISEHHIIEDLAAEWLEEEHINPLVEYCKKQMTTKEPLAVF